MNVFNNISVKWKIYLIAIVSIIGFGCYLGFNVWVNSNNSKLLASLQNVSFPVLEKSNANKVRLDRLSELLNNAVLTGEQEYIDKAEESAKLITDVFGEVLVIDPNKKNEINEIIASFNEYFTLAKEIATEMTQGASDMEKIGAAVKKKEESLAKLNTQLDSFITQAHETFSGSIKTANSNSTQLLTSGFVIWFINILILTVTVYTIARIILSNINSVSESLHEIARGGGDFSKRITVDSMDEIGKLASGFNELMDNLRKKTNDLMSMMQNMHNGLFTITEDEKIHQEYSQYIEEIFQTTDVAGRYYADLLFDGALLGSNELDQIKVAVSSLLGSDEMMFDFNKHLLVKEYSLVKIINGSSSTRILEVDWDPIVSDGVIYKIMVTVRDVTELRVMQIEAEEQKKELQIVGQLLKESPDKFYRFYENAIKLLDKNEIIIKQNKEKNQQAIADLFINMHTIKGNARTYNFTYITDPVHEVENTYDRLRKEEDFVWDSQQCLNDLHVVRNAITQYFEIKTSKLNFANNENELDRDVVCIPRESFAEMLNGFSTLMSNSQADPKQAESLLSLIKSFDAIPFDEVIRELADSLPSIAMQVSKEAPNLILNTQQVTIRNDYADMLKDVFTHLLRNSVDHGIETLEERIEKQKNPQANITIQAEIVNDTAHLYLWDDGRGLNLKRIKEKAMSGNCLTESAAQDPQKIAECLFLSGVSTAEKITAISGRGVGMDAVRQYLQQNDCKINLLLAENVKATDEFAAFKIQIELPRKIYEVARFN